MGTFVLGRAQVRPCIAPVADVLSAQGPRTKVPTSRLDNVQVSKIISFDLRRAKANFQLGQYIESMPDALNAMSLHTDSRGLGWLASSEDVSRQDAGDRASHGWP